MDDKGKRELSAHIRMHVNYPTTKRALLEACSHMAHVPAETRQWATASLEDRTYTSADDVLSALGW